jgi:hypothetical protein
MQEQAEILAIAACAEAAFAGPVGGKMQLRGVPRIKSGGRLSIVSTCRPPTRWLVWKPVVASISCTVTALLARKRPNWIACLRSFASGRTHSVRCCCIAASNALPTHIPAACRRIPKACPDHANRTLRRNRWVHRFGNRAGWQVVPRMCRLRACKGRGSTGTMQGGGIDNRLNSVLLSPPPIPLPQGEGENSVVP